MPVIASSDQVLIRKNNNFLVDGLPKLMRVEERSSSAQCNGWSLVLIMKIGGLDPNIMNLGLVSLRS